MRMRHKPWAKDKMAEHPDIVISKPERYKGRWRALFGMDAPLFVEIGTGKGKFLSGMAEAYPERLFIGIEREESVIVSALQKALDQSLSNLKLLNVNAAELTDYFASGEVAEIYLNFSDPWPKKRHEKRRLSHEIFLKAYKKVLEAGGKINLKTDNQGLFEYSIESFSRFGLIIQNVSLDLHAAPFEKNVTTEYEEKFSQKGQRIYRCEAVFR
ncbi:tRNA (guanosine(46)-N7)-methyltransferase TrmB [Camelliibacillus cellulosilyticus]|uniref:tRNA (guanine-N(7)-)-methyltransferase n=1 Tax=Camelliibacillus cellulosilyticus TaxID=2174486 RepID=A0ABV9GMZ4_9BACL